MSYRAIPSAATALLISALALGACGGSDPADAAPATAAKEEMADAGPELPMVSAVTDYQDPVCQMDVEEDAAFRHTHDGITYGFCSAVCQKQFEGDPGAYAVVE